MQNLQKPTLILVGSGIKFKCHLTIEAIAHIKHAHRVLYLVNEPATKYLIHKYNSESISLDNFYLKFSLREECYKGITNFILDTLKKINQLCVVIYGHPTVYAKPGLDAIKKAKQNDYNTLVLPGISSEAFFNPFFTKVHDAASPLGFKKITQQFL